MKQPIIAIPAYKPGPELVKLVRKISQRSAEQGIVIVDDGSSPEHQCFFSELAGIPQVEILRHAVNLGKGQALKTAFNHILVNHPDCPGVVTADADGQHDPDDILTIADFFSNNSDTFCLGIREFSHNIPLRSRFGNKLTRLLFRFLIGRDVQDTQTGLRAIPAQYLPELLQITASGYEFELEMLICSVRNQWSFAEIPIKTVYIDGNKSSHFHPLFDSLKVYFVFLRFSALALTTAGIDFLVFSAAYFLCRSIFASIVFARIVAGTYNFAFGKLLVFRSKGRILPEAIKYSLTVLILMLISYTLIYNMVDFLGVNVILSKAIVETSLYFVSFSILNTFVFKP